MRRFTKIHKTQHPPKDKPVMAWDGDCGFCHYWVIRWKTYIGDAVTYKPYQEVAPDFPDIELKYFRQALRFIDTDGRVYTGPAAAFRAFRFGSRWRWLMPLYSNFAPARWISDISYMFISAHRPRFYKISVALFGKNPARQKPWWVLYLAGLMVLGSIPVLFF